MKNKFRIATAWVLLGLAIKFEAISQATCSGLATVGGARPLRAVIANCQEGRNQDERIIGGWPIAIADAPWQVALLATEVSAGCRSQFCGGVVLSPRVVVTAAHCVDRGTLPAQIKILSGDADLRGENKLVRVSSIHVHERWCPITKDFDIAILILSESVEYHGIELIDDLTEDALPVASEITVTGWGRVTEAGIGSDTLRATRLPLQSRQNCNRPASYDGRVSANMICAGRVTGGSDACLGDSGGPATIRVGTKNYLMGLASWGEGCGRARKYGVFTRVSRFNEWLLQTLNSEGSDHE
jgi:trypsin